MTTATATFTVYPVPFAMSRLHAIEAQVEAAAEQVCEFAESLSETEAQHQSETALYGDSWPGACQQIADLRAGLNGAERRLVAAVRALDHWFPVLGPERPAPTHCDLVIGGTVCGRPLDAHGECGYCQPF